MYRDFLILGGAGLVGTQVCREIVTHLNPRRVVVASLFPHEAEQACEGLREEFGHRVAFEPAHGNLFVPSDLAELSRAEILTSSQHRGRLLDFLYGDFDIAYRENHLVNLIRRHRPEVVVDCVNTATGLSYQNVFHSVERLRDWLGDEGLPKQAVPDLEAFLLSQSVPQIILHMRLLQRATGEHDTKVYLKVGTTGTGGMGMNIPYTHSEDKPSKVLLAKTEAGFGHTGLMFVFARTPGAPVVKEIKPAAMIGYRAVRTIEAKDRSGNSRLVEPTKARAIGTVDLRQDRAPYQDKGSLQVSVVDTGENGVFTRGEFAAITALGQMEYITPEEIARVIVLEIRGANTGQDVISAIDGAVLNPSYKAGLLRSVALRDLKDADEASALPSVALGRLGPPELSKLLFEAHLLKEVYGTLSAVAEASPSTMTQAIAAHLDTSAVRLLAPSIGIPILLPDGQTILRGPHINVPETPAHRTSVGLTAPDVDRYAQKGWVDLRADNLSRWQDRVRRMIATRRHIRDAGSAAASIHAYLPSEFEIGEVVAWIFNNEMDGYRIK
ncbi:MAG: hypothetical protein EA397_15215 [Deltaproteobacteria bacterium]|nr:MAG: hypothetical protein EA397_15215 [Deltaproteobacteria bacterium]